jgi:predicted RNA-binding protein YlqC (UPF0109 family)
MKDLVEYVVKSLVDNPDDVQVYEVPGKASIIIELEVAADDMGRIIGKGGRVIDSIRSIVQIRAAKEGQRVELELLEAGESR